MKTITAIIPKGTVEKAVQAITSQDFSLQGDIALFGNPDLTATLKVWQGPLPPSVTGSVSLIPCAELATLKQDQLRLSLVAPGLAGTSFDDIVFQKAQIFHQNCAIDPKRSVGWNIDADWVIDASCGTLHAVLVRLLGVDRPTLRMHGELGPSQKWTALLDFQSITLEGQFAGLDVVRSAPAGLQFTTLGVRLLGAPGVPGNAMKYSYAAFGTLHLDIPESTAPLELSYDIHEANGEAILQAQLGSAWSNAFGVTGLTISTASFTTKLSVESPWEHAEFDVSASFKHKDTQIDFQGTYAPGGAFDLKATVAPFDISIIGNVFDAFHGCAISVPDIDVKIQSATFSIVSGKGLEVHLNNVELADHTAATAVLTDSPDGVVIRGDLGDKVELDDVLLKNAYIQVTLPSSSNQDKRGSDAVLGGQVEVLKGLDVDSTAHLYQNKNKTGYEWAMVADLTPKENDAWELSKLVPEVHGTPLDLSLTKVVFTAASQDNPEVGSTLGSNYSIQKGIQFHGTVSGGILALDSLTRKSHEGLSMRAGPSSKGFDIELFTPSETCISLGNGLMTTPIVLKIETQPSVRLMVSAGLSIKLSESGEPLNFGVTFDAGVNSASATGEMAGWWANPCNAGQNVKLGPSLALDLEIIYAQFVSTGTVSGFGLRGGIMIGKTEAQCAMQISEDPMRDMLSAEVGALTLEDLTSFHCDVTGVSIPTPPGGCMTFEKVKLYICPAGTTLGTVSYPQGCSFMADMIFFGKRADIACSMSKTEGICIQGGVDNFELGPLTVRGKTGPRATLDCTLGPSSQHILVDGVATFLEDDVEVHVDISTLPEQAVTFSMNVTFADELKFDLHASMHGHLAFDRSLLDADFALEAELEQHIIEHIQTHLLEELKKAHHAPAAGIDAADKTLQTEKQKVEDSIQTAKKDVGDTCQTWESKQKEVTSTAGSTVETYQKEVSRLEDDVKAARNKYNEAVAAAEQDVKKANSDREEAMKAAKSDLEKAQNEATQAIAAAQKAVDDAQADVDRLFGAARGNIDAAEAKVQTLQKYMDAQWETVYAYETPSWYEAWKLALVPSLMVPIAALKAAKVIADGTLESAKAVLYSTEYVEKQTLLAAANSALEAAKATSDEAIEAASASMNAADETSRVAVSASTEAMDAARQGVAYGVLQSAILRLNDYKRHNEESYQAASQTVNELENCLEHVAHESAKAALSAVESAATESIDVAQKALDEAHEAGDFALDIAGKIAEESLQTVDIRHVHISGSLRGLVTCDNSTPLQAHVEVVLLGHAMPVIDVTYDPKDSMALVTSIFEEVWKNIDILK
ncbi:hypothetical protein CMQ_2438 [Grosmannia clavigera kw1407]|uniref:Uncharacterized protein n=1 Tax=Grosmannia clavigera (strain kw1407 / UAMH 11150) TaxID=655863 RepID=F0XJR1_GROCL|nr:uncharacterized protein CMQ_2438 [Grosmannia clavigera kw1407]EFX02389.1 hypothetical protein CMQ_2438 [Grosmannia clavigera kw1407]